MARLWGIIIFLFLSPVHFDQVGSWPVYHLGLLHATADYDKEDDDEKGGKPYLLNKYKDSDKDDDDDDKSTSTSQSQNGWGTGYGSNPSPPKPTPLDFTLCKDYMSLLDIADSGDIQSCKNSVGGLKASCDTSSISAQNSFVSSSLSESCAEYRDMADQVMGPLGTISASCSQEVRGCEAECGGTASKIRKHIKDSKYSAQYCEDAARSKGNELLSALKSSEDSCGQYAQQAILLKQDYAKWQQRRSDAQRCLSAATAVGGDQAGMMPESEQQIVNKPAIRGQGLGKSEVVNLLESQRPSGKKNIRAEKKQPTDKEMKEVVDEMIGMIIPGKSSSGQPSGRNFGQSAFGVTRGMDRNNGSGRARQGSKSGKMKEGIDYSSGQIHVSKRRVRDRSSRGSSERETFSRFTKHGKKSRFQVAGSDLEKTQGVTPANGPSLWEKISDRYQDMTSSLRE